MLFLVAFLCCISLFFEMTICSGGSEERAYRQVMFKASDDQYRPIGYFNGVGTVFTFNQNSKPNIIQLQNTKGIEDLLDFEVHTAHQGLQSLNYNVVLVDIVKFLNKTNFDDVDKQANEFILQMLNATSCFESLLNDYYKLNLSDATVKFLSCFITAICHPQKQNDKDVVRLPLDTFLKDFKNHCEVIYENAQNQIWEDNSKEFFLTVGFGLFLIVGLYNEYKNRLSSRVQKDFGKIACFTAAYVGFSLSTSPLLGSLLYLYFAREKYIKTYDDILNNEYFE